MCMILQKWDKCEIHREEQMFKFQSSKNVLVFVLLDEDEIRTIIEYLPQRMLVLLGITQHSNPRGVDYLYTNGSKSCMWRTSEHPKHHSCQVLFKLGLAQVYSAYFQQYFSHIVAVSFIGGENRNTRRKPLICRKALTNFIT